MTTAQIEAAPTAMIDRVASLLEVFDSQGQLTLAQICRRANIPRSSAHRILQRLVELGWVERQGFRYALGIRMFELGSQVVRQDVVHRAALPFMNELHRTTSLTVHLSILLRSEILHLERVGMGPDVGQGWRPGARQSAVQTAGGRALLARLNPAAWPALIPEPSTGYGIRSRVHLERELRRIRDRGGVAVDNQGCAWGVTVIAAPIAAPMGVDECDARVALSVSGPTDAIEIDRTIAAVRLTAAEIWYAASGVSSLRGRRMRAMHVPDRARRAQVGR